MDGRGRLAEPLKGFARLRARTAFGLVRNPAVRGEMPAWAAEAMRAARGLALRVDRFSVWLVRRVAAVKPRHAGTVGAAAFLAAAAGYGVVKGEHGPALVEAVHDARDQAANAAGFNITELAVTGQHRLSEVEILAMAGVSVSSSLLFLDVDAARRGLEASPWIAEATVRKLYPGRLEIAVREREAFAVWQREGQLAVIAADGTVLGRFGERPLPPLPFVVGKGAERRAAALVELLDRYPALRDQVRAAVLVADRRWNLRLTNGLDIRLPEEEIAPALDMLMALDRDRKILTRDITAVDLRLPGRVTVRLSEDAAKQREEALKEQRRRAGGRA